MNSFSDESIISDFVAESREHLAAIEPDLLAMEQEGSKAGSEVINRVFRAVHSIKGGAGFFSFESLKRLSHAMEGVLMQVRDGHLAVDASLMDVVFAALDRLRAMLDDIHQSDAVPCQKELDALEAILKHHGVEPGSKMKAYNAQGDVFDLDTESVRSVLRRGMHLYHAIAYLHKDIKDKGLNPLDFLNNALSVGTCLDAYIDVMAIADLKNCLEQDLPVTLLFATVLESDLAALGLNLPPEQVRIMDMARIIEAATQVAEGQDALAEAPVLDTESVQKELDNPEEKAARQARESGNETLRVRVDLLTHLMNLAGELVLGRNQLLRAVDSHVRGIPGLSTILQNVNQVTTEIQEGIMQTRMQPIGTVFSRFPRIIRDMSRQLGKQIEVQIEGGDVELDKSIVELLVDPLTHIIRNCADHAIEGPEERKRRRKPPVGLVHLNAFHEGGQVNIAIRDDGRGIDAKKVLAKALKNGLVTQSQASEMSEREIVKLVFEPGFSTAEAISEISGRGVGMDVVKTNVEKLGGHVEVETEVGGGTTVRLRLPLTLAIIPSMIVGVGTQRFAIPQVNVVEFVWVKASEVKTRIEQVQGALVLRLRDKLLPLVRLSQVLGLESQYWDAQAGERKTDRRQRVLDARAPEGQVVESPDLPERRQDWRSDTNIVVLRLGHNVFGAIVDELFDIEEIVVKPLSSFLQGTRCFSGATILGDGRVIMILDAGGLSTLAQLRFVDLQAEEKRRAQEEQEQAALTASRRRSVILFRAAEEEHFAIGQDHVQRLERIKLSRIERIGGREYIEYLGEGLPIIRMDHVLQVSPMPEDLQDAFVIIPKMGKGRPPAGILISAILDALDVDVELKAVDIKGPGIEGSALVNGRLTIFLDPLVLVRACVEVLA